MKKRTLITAFLGLVVGVGSVYAQQTTSLFDPLIRDVDVTVDSVSDQSRVLGETVGDSVISEEVQLDAETKPAFSQPKRLRIPKLEVDTAVEHVGLDENQRMDVPAADENVAWYQYGPIPGETGSSVLAGHFDTRTGGPAVFYTLNQLDTGDQVTVQDDQGRERTFVVTKIATHQDSNFPIAEVFSDRSGKKLNLITCAGQFDQAAKNYQDRLVVYTQLQE